MPTIFPRFNFKHFKVLQYSISLQGQLRVQGLEEYLRKLIGPNGLFDISKTDALKKSGIGALSDKLKELEKKVYYVL